MSSSDPTDQILIRTKLSAPQLGANFLPRPRLLKLLAGASSHALTLVCAPAGYGKTSLLAEWAAGLAKSRGGKAPNACWLALDAGDNDPYGFLTYLIAAMRLAESRIENAPTAVLSSFPHPPFQAALGILINDLFGIADSFILTLDDYQFISNPVIHEGLAFFVEHLPPNVHMVIAARSDPPIPLARLRARGQLLEVRARDLEFTLAETMHLVNETMALGIDPQDVGLLAERTEGWAAGLQMAGLALKNQANSSEFVRDFSGSNRYILDYLVEEVLESQPAHVQEFLLKTSLLGNLSGPLCDAVIGRAAASGDVTSQGLLEQLDKANMFLVPLDAERTWYRYHHLFADLLQTRLARAFPAEIAQLHTRAAEWFEGQQRIPEAIDHLLSAQAYASACRLIDTQVERLVGRNDMFVLLGWIRRLPPGMAMRHPWFSIAQAWYMLFRDDAVKIEPLLQAAERNIREEDSSELRNVWRGHIACLRGFRADAHGDVSGAIEMAKLGLRYMRPEDTANRNFARYMLGRAYFLTGDLAQAERTFRENVQQCIETGGINIIAPTLSALARMYRTQGRLRDCAQVLQEGLAYIESQDVRRVSVAGTALAGQAYMLLEWNELTAAEEMAHRSLELCERWLNSTSICNCYCVLIRVHLAQGNLPAAGEALQSAEEAIRGHSPFAEALSELNATRVRYWLAAGDISQASHWAQAQHAEMSAEEAFSVPREQNEITLARVLIAEGKPELALQSLRQLEAAAEEGQRCGHLIEIHNLQALALPALGLAALGDSMQALPMLGKSLALAEPEGYVRTYLDEGQPLRKLLESYVQPAVAPGKAYAQKLLAAFAGAQAAGAHKSQRGELAESLTGREVDVLRLMVEGLSNRQIAEALVLSEGTIKFHVHHVLEKLQARTRAEAIAKTRKGNII